MDKSENLILIETAEEVEKLIEDFKDAKFIAYDTETTGLSQDDDIVGICLAKNHNIGYYITLSYWDTEQKKLIDTPAREVAPKLIEFVKTKPLIMHNSVFDCIMTKSVFDIELMPSVHTDTMIMAHLANETWSLKLKDLGAMFFGEDAKAEEAELEKNAKANGGIFNKSKKLKELYKADKEILGKYGAKDALLTMKVFLKLLPILAKENLIKFFYEEESMPLLKGPTYEMNTTGIKVNTERLQKLEQELVKECAELELKILEEVYPYVKERYPGTDKKNTFNPSSGQQRAWLLFIRLGNEFKILTDKGREVARELMGKLPYGIANKRRFIELARAKGLKPEKYIKCDADVLTFFAGKYSWVSKYLEYAKLSKILKTYARGFQKFLRYGIIYPHFHQTGTDSGRYSSSNPNFQNIPKRDVETAKRIRSVIESRKEYSFVNADYSQIEPRVMAAYAQDKALLECFKNNQDVYSVIGVPIYKVSNCSLYKEDENSFGKLHPIFRNNTKTLVLANNYGQTPKKLASSLLDEKGHHYTEEQAREIIEDYFNIFPGLSNFIQSTHDEVKDSGIVYNMFGRPRRLPDAKKIRLFFGDKPHDQLNYNWRKLLNISVNFKMQSTTASIMNRAAIKFCQERDKIGLKAKIVLQIHDELIVEAPDEEAEKTAKLLQHCMETAAELPGVAMRAEPNIAKNLADLK